MRKCLSLYVIFATLVLPGFSLAEEEEKDETPLTTMEEVVVTATRYEESVRKVPSSVTVITAEEIKESGATNIPDLLESRANIHVKTYSGNASQAMIDLRGFGGDNPYGKTLVLLDGRRMNRPDMSSINWLQVPLELIERIEVVRGTHTALYGDSAIGGVINIITKKGTREPRFTFSAIVGEDSIQVERFGLVGKEGNFSYAVNGGNQGNNGWRNRTGFESKGGGLRFGYDFTEGFSISAGFSYQKTEFEMPGCLTKQEMNEDREQIQPAREWYPPAWGGFPANTPAHTDDEAENEYYNSNVLVEWSLGKAGDIEVNFIYGNKDIATDMPSGWVPAQYNQLDIDTFGVSPKYILDGSLFGFGNKLIAGFDIYHETLSLNQYLDQDRHNKAWKAELKKDSLGWFLRNEFSPIDELILGVGYRRERATFKGKKTEYLGGGFGTAFASEDKTHHEDAFDIGLTWLLGERSRVYGKFATLYRYPFTDEHVNYNGLNDGFNTDLNAEKGKSYEIGGDYSPTAGLKMGLTLFQMDLKDEITWDNTLNRNVNLDETRHRGVEVSLSHTINGLLRCYGSYTYQEGEFQKGEFKGKVIPFVPNHHFSAGLDLSLPYDIEICPEILYVSRSYLGNDWNNSSEKLDGYSVYNFSIRYEPEWKNHNFMAFVGAKNIFDKEYETWGFENDPNYGAAPDNTYYPSNGREFTGGISFQF